MVTEAIITEGAIAFAVGARLIQIEVIFTPSAGRTADLFTRDFDHVSEGGGFTGVGRSETACTNPTPQP
jgi:hypothetical protein